MGIHHLYKHARWGFKHLHIFLEEGASTFEFKYQVDSF